MIELDVLEIALYSEWVGLIEIFVVWIFEMTWNGALSVPMRKEATTPSYAKCL